MYVVRLATASQCPFLPSSFIAEPHFLARHIALQRIKLDGPGEVEQQWRGEGGHGFVVTLLLGNGAWPSPKFEGSHLLSHEAPGPCRAMHRGPGSGAQLSLQLRASIICQQLSGAP